jgi:hypothetical protein
MRDSAFVGRSGSRTGRAHRDVVVSQARAAMPTRLRTRSLRWMLATWVFTAPVLDDDLRFGQAGEQLEIQQR